MIYIYEDNYIDSLNYNIGVRDDRTPGGLHKSRYRRFRDDEADSIDSQFSLESSIQTLINCDPYISPSFVTTEG